MSEPRPRQSRRMGTPFACWLASLVERHGDDERPIQGQLVSLRPEFFWREVEVAATNAEWLEAVEEIA